MRMIHASACTRTGNTFTRQLQRGDHGVGHCHSLGLQMTNRGESENCSVATVMTNRGVPERANFMHV